MSTGTLNGHTLTHCRVALPAWGIGYVDCSVDVEVALAGKVSLQLADLPLACAVVTGGPYKGRSHYRLCLGANGWGKPVKAKGYASDAGVKLRTVLGDAALEANESIVLPAASVTVGQAFDRIAGPASTVLQLLAQEAWYVGEDGVTRLGKRPAVVYSGNATRGPYDPARGVLEVAAESIASLVPGVVVDGVEAVDVIHELTPDKLRTTIWGRRAANTSRQLAAMRRLVEQLDPRARYAGLCSYRIVSQEEHRLNLQPERASMGMPDLRRVRVMPGVPGCSASHALGAIVLVAFVNRDPSRPRVVGFDDAESPGFAPSRLDLVGEDDLAVTAPGAIGRIVRYGDPFVGVAEGVEGTMTILAPASLSKVRA